EANEQAAERLKEQAGGSPGSKAEELPPHPMTQAGEDVPSDGATLEAKSPPADQRRPATPVKAAPGSPGAQEVAGADRRQEARHIQPRPETQSDPLRDYAKLLTKKVQSRLVYPETGRWAGLRGAAAVSFTILPDGALRPDSLRIVSSSGEAKLDESALQTIRAAAPFDPPKREITLKITVIYGPQR
ncbi:MAG: TonB family protein, partial [Methylocystis sp.]